MWWRNWRRCSAPPRGSTARGTRSGLSRSSVWGSCDLPSGGGHRIGPPFESGEIHEKGRALTLGCFKTDFAEVLIHDGFDDAHAQPMPFFDAVAGPAGKPVEQDRLQFQRQAAAVVLDPEPGAIL